MIRRRLFATLVIGPLVALIAVAGLTADRLDGVQAQWEDMLQPGLETPERVVVVAIDRGTMAAVGEGWPWSRQRHAELLAAIGTASPAAVVYDVLFADPRPGDEAMAAAMARTPTVLGAALTLTAGRTGPPTIVDGVLPTDALAGSAADIGHVNVTSSADRGVVRELPLYALDDRGIARPSVVLAAVALADGTASGPLVERPDGVQVGDRFVPLDDGELRVNWSGDLRSGDVIPAIDVLRGNVAGDRFEDRIVLVGVTEPTLGDQHLVAVDRSGGTSGVLVLANATNTILAAGYLTPASGTAQALLVALVAIVVTALFVWLRLSVAAVVTAVLVATIAVVSSWRFHTEGELWNVVWPVTAALLAAAAGTVWRYFSETRHRRQAWKLFSTYVPASVVAQMEDPRRLAAAVEGSRLEVSVLFCDLRGFTPIAATLEPPQVRQLLDRYYDYAVAVVHRHGGTVMQFVGDEVFAVFGAPVADAAAGDQAVRCAVALQDEIGRLDDNLAGDGLPAIRYGIGLHRGPVVAAHVGTTDRRQYSVVGDTVNVGSRLCSQAGAGEVVASPAALEPAVVWASGILVPSGSVELKGVAVPMTIFRSCPPGVPTPVAAH